MDALTVVHPTASFRNLFTLAPDSAQVDTMPIPNEAFFAQLGLGEAPNRDDVLEGIRASGAFPFAFPPVMLEYRTYDVAARRFMPKTGWFVDGGVLENTPLGLAGEINRRSTSSHTNPWLKAVKDVDIYVYVSPGVRAWDPEFLGLSKPEPKNQRPLGTYLNWLGSVVGAGAMARLTQAAEEYPFFRQDRANALAGSRMIAPVRYLPITGDHLAHFFAFTERDFRVFDYVVGMVDANENFSRIVPDSAQTFEFPKPGQNESDPDQLANKYACVDAFYGQCIRNEAALASDCNDTPRLPEQCDHIGPRFRALLTANWQYRNWSKRLRTGEKKPKSELDKFLELLAASRFKFEDAPDGWRQALDDGSGARFERRLAEVALERLTEKEKWYVGKSLRLGSRLLADAAIYREFPVLSVHVGYPERGLEAGVGFKWGDFGQYAGIRFDVLARGYGYRSQYVINAEGDYYKAKFFNIDGEFGLTGIVSPGMPGILDLEASVGPLVSTRTMPWRDGGHWVFTRYGLYLASDVVLFQRMYLRFENQWFVSHDTSHYFSGSTQEDAADFRLQVSLGVRFMPGN